MLASLQENDANDVVKSPPPPPPPPQGKPTRLDLPTGVNLNDIIRGVDPNGIATIPPTDVDDVDDDGTQEDDEVEYYEDEDAEDAQDSEDDNQVIQSYETPPIYGNGTPPTANRQSPTQKYANLDEKSKNMPI